MRGERTVVSRTGGDQTGVGISTQKYSDTVLTLVHTLTKRVSRSTGPFRGSNIGRRHLTRKVNDSP